jgi:FtsZ-binding cell division protein ZapB
MSVASTAELLRLDGVLLDRPAGRAIVGHAVDTIQRLRAELAEAEETARKSTSLLVEAANRREHFRAKSETLAQRIAELESLLHELIECGIEYESEKYRVVQIDHALHDRLVALLRREDT